MKPKYNANGLVPIVIQDANTGDVLSLFYGNAPALRQMQATRYVWRYSRQQKRVIKKGETSGNYQRVVSVLSDCDGDALLVKVIPEGPACHTGSYSCFGGEKNILSELVGVITERKKNPKISSYTSRMVRNKEKIVEKLREELGELIAARSQKDIRWEAADLLYFLLVYLENREVRWGEVLKELRRRRTQPKE